MIKPKLYARVLILKFTFPDTLFIEAKRNAIICVKELKENINNILRGFLDTDILVYYDNVIHEIENIQNFEDLKIQ